MHIAARGVNFFQYRSKENFSRAIKIFFRSDVCVLLEDIKQLFSGDRFFQIVLHTNLYTFILFFDVRVARAPYNNSIEVIIGKKLEQFNRCFYPILKWHFDIHKDNLILTPLLIEFSVDLLLASLPRECEFNNNTFFF